MIIYTLPTCPKCKVAKAKLAAAGIEYEECQDMAEMEKYNLKSAPYVRNGDKLFDFSAIMAELKNGGKFE
jgi:glutaredoxin